jgi:hypothetical protein
MAAHACHRCGHDARCSHGTWADRPPWPAALAAVPLGTVALMSLWVYPFVCVPVLLLAAVAYLVHQRQRHTHALALRAGLRARRPMAAPLPLPPAPRPVQPVHRCADSTTARRHRYARKGFETAAAQKRTWKSGRTTCIARWRLPDRSEQARGGFSTRKAALAHAVKMEQDAARGLTFDPKAGKATFRDVAAAWLDCLHDLKDRTRREYGQILAPAAERRGGMREIGIDAVFGGYPVNAITRDRIVGMDHRESRCARSPAERSRQPGCRGRPRTVPHRRAGLRAHRRDAVAVRRDGARGGVVGSASW